MKSSFSTYLAVGAIGISLVTFLTLGSVPVIADPHPEDHVKEGNNGQCWKLQKELNLGGTKEDCRDSFTGKDHHDNGGGDNDGGDGDVDPELPP
jgi:hypothetical protein